MSDIDRDPAGATDLPWFPHAGIIQPSWAPEFDDRERVRIIRPDGGGSIWIDRLHDGRFDLSLVAPQGHSTALYLSKKEAKVLAKALREVVRDAV